MESKAYAAVTDRFTDARGGYSTLYAIACAKCKDEILLYQKDGPGPLLRMYADRILAFKGQIDRSPHTMDDLTCPACHRVLAAAMIYEKEKRKAFRLFVGAITRTARKNGVFPKRTRAKRHID